MKKLSVVFFGSLLGLTILGSGSLLLIKFRNFFIGNPYVYQKDTKTEGIVACLLTGLAMIFMFTGLYFTIELTWFLLALVGYLGVSFIMWQKMFLN